MKHVTSSHHRLPVLSHLPVTSKNISVSSNDLLSFRIPHNKLAATIIHCVEFINIHRLACTSSCRPESYFAQTTDFFHHIRSILRRHHINLIMTLIRHTKHLFWRQLTPKQVLTDRLDDFFFHIFLKSFLSLILSILFQTDFYQPVLHHGITVRKPYLLRI